MSERMIELHRAKMGLPPLIQPKSSIMNGPMLGNNASGNPHSMYHNGTVAANVPALAPTATVHQHAAVAAVMSEDEMLQKFLHLISTSSFDDAASTGNTSEINSNRRTAPTVPLALSRRLLHRQGAGFLDETVAAIVSGAADRFLATVLQQAIACRDRRLKGEDLISASNRNQRQELANFRKRRRKEMKVRRRKRRKLLQKREQSALSIIQNHEEQQKQQLPQQGKKGSSGSGKSKSSKSSKKTKSNSTNKTNNNTVGELPHSSLDANIHSGNLSLLPGQIAMADTNNQTTLSEDDDDYDSLDEEAEYYEKFYKEDNTNDEDNSDDDNDSKNANVTNKNSSRDTNGTQGNMKDNQSEEEDDDDDDDEDDDSVDEDDEDLQEDEDESRYMLLLRDLTRPLQAWGIDLTGKIGLGAFPPVLTKVANTNCDPAKDEEELDEKDIMDTSPDDEMIDPTTGEGEDADNNNTGNDSVAQSPDVPSATITKKSSPKSTSSKDENSNQTSVGKNNPNADKAKPEPTAKRALPITKDTLTPNNSIGGNMASSSTTNATTFKASDPLKSTTDR